MPEQHATGWTSATASEETWTRMYRRLMAFRERHGHFFVPRRHPNPDLRALGRWAGEQRVAHNKGLLDPHRFEQLTVAGFPFDYHAERWESLFSQLQRFRDRYGDCHVPFKDRRWGGLARWVQVQRRNYHASRLSATRMQRLEALGFAWRLQRGRLAPARLLRERPSVFLLRLEAFREAHGHVHVPPFHGADETLPQLCELAGRFAASGELCPEATRLLQAWGFDFENARRRAEGDPLAFIGGWDGFVQALDRFRQAHGHANVPVRPPPEHAVLSRAAAVVRRLAREGADHLPPAVHGRLRDAGFQFELPERERPPTDPDRIL